MAPSSMERSLVSLNGTDGRRERETARAGKRSQHAGKKASKQASTQAKSSCEGEKAVKGRSNYSAGRSANPLVGGPDYFCQGGRARENKATARGKKQKKEGG